MSRFNAPPKVVPGLAKTVNLAGGDAYDRSPKVALASLVLTSLAKDTYYSSASESLRDVRVLAAELTRQGELRYVAKAALYARHVHGLRSISHVLAGEVAALRSRAPEQRGAWGPDFFDKIVFRPDDASQIAAYWISTYAAGKDKWTLPSSMKRGFARVFERTSADQLAKYDSGSLTLRQLAHLVHPTGPKGSKVYDLRGGTLKSADTHEVALSKAGEAEDVSAAKAGAWLDLFQRGKVRYLAALKNCLNILVSAPECVDMLCALLTSHVDVQRSKVLPYQFLEAHRAVRNANLLGEKPRRVLSAIQFGAELALANMPQLEGTTLVAIDCSGSMQAHKELACLLAASFLATNSNSSCLLFSERATPACVPTRIGVWSTFESVHALAQQVTGGTNFNAVFEATSMPFSHFLILTDEQGWQGSPATPEAPLAAYRQRSGMSPAVFTWDLVGSKTSMFAEPNVFALAGLSSAVFSVIGSLSRDRYALVREIEEVSLFGS